MENKIAEWLGIRERTGRSGQGLSERSLRLPRVLMVAAGNRTDDVAAIQANLAYQELRSDGWSVGRCDLREGPMARRRQSTDETRSGRISCLKRLVRTLPRWDVVHVFVSSLTELISFSMPAVLLGRFFGRRIVVQMYSPHLAEWLERWGRVIVPVLRQADVVVGPDGRGIAAFQEHRLRFTQLPSLVDGRLFVPREIESLQPRMITTRALEPHANPGLVLRAHKIVKQKYPRAELVMIGEGSMKEELLELVETDRINGVIFPGAVPHSEMVDHFGEADLYVNGSFRSGVPVSMLEARACGLPVVSLGQHDPQRVAEIKSHIDLADAVLALIEAPDKVQKLSLSAAEEKRNSEWSECRGKWTRLYLGLAGR